MKSIFTNGLWATAFAGSMLVAGPAMAAPTVSLMGSTSVTPGGSLQLNVAATDFADLYAYQFDITFDGSVITATNVLEGSFLSTQGSTFFDGGTVDNSGGTVSSILNTLIGPGTGADGSGSLAQLTFNIGSSFTGSRTIGISNFTALDSSLNPIDVTVQGLTVSAVPEPASLVMMLAGLGMFAGVKLKRRSNREVVEA